MLTPFCGGGAGPSDIEPADTDELTLNPAAKLAITKSFLKRSLASEAIDRFQPKRR